MIRSIYAYARLSKHTFRFYNEKVIEYFENPPNVGSLDKKNPNVGTGTVGSVACGDLLKFQVEVDENGTINKAVFKAFGCGSVIASSAYATELLQGMKMEDAYNIKNTDISQYLKLPPVKLHCSLLAEEAIKKALDDVKNKKTQNQQNKQE